MKQALFDEEERKNFEEFANPYFFGRTSPFLGFEKNSLNYGLPETYKTPSELFITSFDRRFFGNENV